MFTIYAPQIVLLEVTRRAYRARSKGIGKFDTKTKLFTTAFLYKLICLYGTHRCVTVLVQKQRPTLLFGR
jgi:hypothetical protein